MRTKKAFKNSFFTVLSFMISAILGVLNRSIFLRNLSGDFLGYESLFTGIFTLLSFTELGISDVIATHMYKAVADKDSCKVSSLLSLYKKIYIIVGICIAILGIIIMFLLPLLIKDNQRDWSYVRLLYVIQLIATLATYFLSYQRLLLVAHQENYLCANVDSVITVISQIIRFFILICLQNYTLYAVVLIFKNILSNVVISRIAKTRYPNIKNNVSDKLSSKERSTIYGEVKDFAIQRLARVTNQSTDNIVVSAFKGPTLLGFFSNYTLIFSYINAIVYRVIEPMQSTFGNLVFSNEEDGKSKQIFNIIDLFCFFVSSTIFTGIISSMQKFITIWIGDQYLFPFLTVVLLAISLYITCMSYPTYYFRILARNYSADKYYIIFSTVIKIILSIILILFWGLNGIIVATIISSLISWYANAKVMLNSLIDIPIEKFIAKHFIYMCFVIIEAFIGFYLTKTFTNNLLGLVLTILSSIGISIALKIVVFSRTKSFKDGFSYFKQIVSRNNKN